MMTDADMINAREHAIRILQGAAIALVYRRDDGRIPGSQHSYALITLHNAVFYLLTGRFGTPRGITEAI